MVEMSNHLTHTDLNGTTEVQIHGFNVNNLEATSEDSPGTKFLGPCD